MREIVVEWNNLFKLLDNRNQDILSLIEYIGETNESIEQVSVDGLTFRSTSTCKTKSEQLQSETTSKTKSKTFCLTSMCIAITLQLFKITYNLGVTVLEVRHKNQFDRQVCKQFNSNWAQKHTTRVLQTDIRARLRAIDGKNKSNKVAVWKWQRRIWS